MAPSWYREGLGRFARKEISWPNDPIYAQVMDSQEYSAPNVGLGGDLRLSALPAGGKIGAPAALTGKAVYGDVLGCDNIVTGALTGDPAELLVIYFDPGTGDANTVLLLLWDGLTVTPNGGTYTFNVAQTGDRLAVL